MSLIPTKKQWQSWSLPSRIGVIGTLVTLLSFGTYLAEKTYGIVSYIISASSEAEPEYKIAQHKTLVKQVKEEINQKLAHHIWSFDQIHYELFNVSRSVLNEALSRGVEEGSFGHKVIELKNNEGSIQRVTGYYVRENSK